MGMILSKGMRNKMTTNIKFQDLTNLTTTRVTSDYDTITTQSIDDGNLKRTLIYAIPLSCLVIILVILVVIGIRQRHCVMKKLISLKQMRNTNPKFYQTTGLRRDSEFESFSQEDIQSPTNGQEYSLTTVC
jgi:hypothetical protein